MPIIPVIILVIAPELIGSDDNANAIAAEVAGKIAELLSKEVPRVATR